ncbi:hypothetical protein [Hymenobacter rubripertinctus]|uniref:Uncharacterized protein n=1 Tax=Hymenobacter rubripertinctus TaxID=2029981 RepID=A0A418R0S1_9BACT|nr:hypothetical protein [Hymenobacter rubripertinctus]RIY11022.1 hypothetical protein D0T11_08410 [Hymenobacter rubripertinctus]
MKQNDDFDDDDLLGDDDELDNFASTGGNTTRGSAESQLAAKYSDYLMWRDTGSSHDEALDLANMSEDEYDEAEAGNDPESGGKFTSLDELDEDDFSDDENDEYGSTGSSRNSGRNSDYD